MKNLVFFLILVLSLTSKKTKIKWNNKKYYTFPTPEELSKATVRDLRLLGLGFRDSRVYETTQIINDKVHLFIKCTLQ